MAIGQPYWNPWKKKKPSPSPGMLVASGGFTARTTSYYIQASEPAPKPELKDVGLAIEPIVAMREYQVCMDEHGPVLLSFNGAAWPRRKALQAFCHNNPLSDHESPAVHCSCGIYAWKIPEGENIIDRTEIGKVWGEVYLWGDVLICDFGYRAEIAYPKALHVADTGTRSSVRVADELAEAYGVPVTLHKPPQPEPVLEEVEFDTTGFSSNPPILPPFPGAGNS